MDWDTTLFNDGSNYQIRVIGYDEFNAFIDDDIATNLEVDNGAPLPYDFWIRPKPVKGTHAADPWEIMDRGEVYVNEVTVGGELLDVAEVVIQSNTEVSPVIVPVDTDGDGRASFKKIVRLIEGENRITINALDKNRNLYTTSIDIIYRVPKVSMRVGSGGGVVKNPNGTMVVIPSGALRKEEIISINALPNAVEEEIQPIDPHIHLLGVPHEFGPDGIIFHEPVTITISYTDACWDLNEDGVRNDPNGNGRWDEGEELDEKLFKIYFWDGERWIGAGRSEVDTVNNKVTTRVNHFTIFDIAMDTSSPPVKFKVFLTKNPFRPGPQPHGTTFVFDLPKPAEVSIRIFDLAGDLVRNLVDEKEFLFPDRYSERWDGDNDFDEYVGSGIYIYQFIVIFEDDEREVVTKPIGVVK
jgi:hypothetical protein